MTRPRSFLVYWVLGLTAVGALAVCVLRDDCTLLTPDQRAFRLFEAEDYEAAVEELSPVQTPLPPPSALLSVMPLLATEPSLKT